MFWDNFKKICDERGLKPTPILKECGISTGSIGRWQKGSSPYADAVLTIAEYLHCSTDILMRGSEFTPSDEPRLTYSELKLLDMYRELPDALQEMVYDSVKTAYDKELKRKDHSSKSSA